MALEIEGRVIAQLPEESGTGKNGTWVKQSFVVETMEQYPKKVCINSMSGKVDLKQWAVGTMVKVSVNIESREYNNRWYTDVRAWRVEPLGNAAPQGAPTARTMDSGIDTIPDYAAPQLPDNLKEDDLPF